MCMVYVVIQAFLVMCYFMNMVHVVILTSLPARPGGPGDPLIPIAPYKIDIQKYHKHNIYNIDIL